MAIEKYVVVPNEVDMVLWNGDNLDEIRDFVKGKYTVDSIGKEEDKEIRFTSLTTGETEDLEWNDVILKNEYGGIQFLDFIDFFLRYQKKEPSYNVVTLFDEKGDVIDSREFPEGDKAFAEYLCTFAEVDTRVARYQIEKRQMMSQGTVTELRQEDRFIVLPSGETVIRTDGGVYFHISEGGTIPISIDEEDGAKLLRGEKTSL